MIDVILLLSTDLSRHHFKCELGGCDVNWFDIPPHRHFKHAVKCECCKGVMLIGLDILQDI